MKFYEIRNKLTNEFAAVAATNFKAACESKGWKPKDCRCIWKAKVENAADPADY